MGSQQEENISYLHKGGSGSTEVMPLPQNSPGS